MSNPYQPPPVSGYGRPHPQGTLVLVLGILGLVLCPVVAVPGLLRANQALHQIDANPHAYSNRSSVVVGRVLSIITLVVWALVILFYLVAVLALGLYRTTP
ncbi:hypothetical protein [Friedmanniella luteola]|uniref:hypothetical protein n=1 Tax=Friedmanniella luteola TaxID=546871 RepID=UPI000B832AD7|nr:hypothetical protein [Friedmanniella luteola]